MTEPLPTLPPAWQLRPIAYRVAPLPAAKKNRRRPAQPAWSGMALILETDATDPLSGPARFGCYLLCQGERVLARGLFLGPGATAADDQELARVARRHQLEPPLPLDGFLALLYRYACQKRLPLVAFNLPAQLSRLAADWTAPEPRSFYEGGVSLILWTRPRIGRRGRRLRNGRRENGYRPRVLLKVLADGSVAAGFGARGEPDTIDRIPEGEGTPRPGYKPPGHLLPLERLAYGLTGRRYRTLAQACDTFQISCPPDAETERDLTAQADDCLSRADAAHRLYLTLLDRHKQQALPLPADRVYSTASYAKATIEAVGITPPLDRYDGDLDALGASMCAAYGGWSGVGIRSTSGSPPVPVRLVDVSGMYPVVAHGIGLWSLLCAERLTLRKVPVEEVEGWIGQQRPEMLRISPELNVFCRVRPSGDVLPHRIKPSKTWLTTIAPLTGDDSLWWPLADVLRSYFETGAIPQIDACLRLEGHGRLPDLKPIELPGLGLFDPNQPDADLFLHLAEGRLRLQAGHGDLDPAERDRLTTVYKLWDNSACSGIYLEVHPEEPRKRARKGIVLGPDGPYETKATSFEDPGKWFFPPFYSLVTAAGRLLLYLAMREGQQAGGTIAYWDTDSLVIVSTRHGGLIPCTGGKERDNQSRECVRALSHAQVEAIRWRLERHSPYTDAVRPEALLTVEGEQGETRSVPIPQPTLFRLEDENFAGTPGEVQVYAVASKRKTAYTVGEDGRAIAVSPSEFALGHLQDPTGAASKEWIADGWQWTALNGPEPDWLDQPALTHVQLTRHADLARLGGRKRNAPRPWDTLIVASADRTHGRNDDANLPRPFTRYRLGLTPAQADWIDFDTGAPLPRVEALDDQASRSVSRIRPTYLRRFRSILAAHPRAPERKASQNGEPCGARTHGLLGPVATHGHTAIPIGRETNYTDQAGVLNDPDYTSYPDPLRDRLAARAQSTLRAHAASPKTRKTIAADLEVSERTLRRYLHTGKARSTTLTRAAALAVSFAQVALREIAPNGGPSGDAASLLYLANRRLTQIDKPSCQACGEELAGRQQRWCSNCRKRPRLRQRRRRDP